MTIPLAQGSSVQLDLRYTSDDLIRFGSLSGDHNPIHEDEAYAQSCGFAGRVVYGGLIMASVSRLIGMMVPGPGAVMQSVQLQFKSPLYVNEPARLEATVDYINPELKVLQLRIEATRSETVIAKGTAQVGWRK